MSAHSAVHRRFMPRAGRVTESPSSTGGSRTTRAMKISIGALAAPAVGLVALAGAAVVTGTNLPGLGSLPGVKGLQGSTKQVEPIAAPGSQRSDRGGAGVADRRGRTARHEKDAGRTRGADRAAGHRSGAVRAPAGGLSAPAGAPSRHPASAAPTVPIHIPEGHSRHQDGPQPFPPTEPGQPAPEPATPVEPALPPATTPPSGAAPGDDSGSGGSGSSDDGSGSGVYGGQGSGGTSAGAEQ